MNGKCKHCGCTAADPCDVLTVDEAGQVVASEPCRWVDAEQTICSGCLDQVNAVTLAHLVTAEMDGVGPMTITREPADWWALAMFLQEAIAAHGDADAATNPTLYAAARLLLDLNELLGRNRPAMCESLSRSGETVFAEYESITIEGAHAALGEEVTQGGIIIPH